MPKFRRGDRVRKVKGSSWQGRIVGEYSTDLTPEGYAIESERERGSVQIYPASALEFAPKECPECGHVFQGNGWDGIDAHWRSKHENIMPYEDAWPMLREDKYRRS